MTESVTIDAQTLTDLRLLLDRQAISDCVVRYARGFDRGDHALMASAFHDDAHIWTGYRGGRRSQNQGINSYLEADLRRREVAQHYITTQSIDIDGDVAHMETYYLIVVKMREGAVPTFLTTEQGGEDRGQSPGEIDLIGGRYVDRLERRNGEWKIALRWSVPDWALTAPAPRHIEHVERGARLSRRDKQDPSYMRPLTDPVRPQTGAQGEQEGSA